MNLFINDIFKDFIHKSVNPVIDTINFPHVNIDNSSTYTLSIDFGNSYFDALNRKKCGEILVTSSKATIDSGSVSEINFNNY
ncbi:MAG: hypothetical protein KKD31_03820, partial [Bacteroidetes bacterium]|nr:hypothetical protein [Bacteroidota bacterium]